jgi:hypothetical protein
LTISNNIEIRHKNNKKIIFGLESFKYHRTLPVRCTHNFPLHPDNEKQLNKHFIFNTLTKMYGEKIFQKINEVMENSGRRRDFIHPFILTYFPGLKEIKLFTSTFNNKSILLETK